MRSLNKIFSKKHKASILGASLIILGGMLAITLSASIVAVQERRSSVGANTSSLAYQAAETGIENVMQVMKASLLINPLATIAEIDTDGTCDGIVNLPGKYKIELKDSSGNVITDCTAPVSSIATIKSIGYSGQNSRAIEVALGGRACNWETFGTFGAGVNNLNGPHSVVDTGGNKIYVADRLNNRISRFDSGSGGTTFGANWQTFGSQGSGAGQFNSPDSVFVDSTNNKVYVTDENNNRVVSFDASAFDGAGWQTFGSPGSGINQFSDPHGIFVDLANDKVYVADTNATSGRLVRFDAAAFDGTGWQTFGSVGSGINQFNLPQNIFVDSTNSNVYVTDYNNNRLVRFDASTFNGTNWQTFGSGPGSGTAEFMNPHGLFVDSANNKVYVTDLNNRIASFDSGSGGTTFGASWQTYGNEGSGVAQFSRPDGIFVDSINNKAYVADYNNNRIIRFDSDCLNADATPPELSCQAPIPGYTNATQCIESIINLTNPVPAWSLATDCTGAKCEYECDTGYTFNGTTCVLSSPSYSCAGSVPANAGLCSGDDTGLSADTPRTVVGSCGIPKCEYTCNAGYAESGGTCVPVVSVMVGHWNLDETSGATAADTSSYSPAANGTLANGPVWASGQINGGLNFDGINDRVSLGNPAKLNLNTNFTISTWVKADSIFTANAAVVAKGVDTTVVIRAGGNTTNCTSTKCFTFRINDGTINAENSVDAFPETTWHHLVMVVGARGAGGLKGYVDGVERVVVDTSGVGNITSLNNWYFGYSERNNAYLDGTVDDVRIYNNALSAADVLALYEASVPSSNIAVRAWGQAGDEQIELRRNGNLIDTWTLPYQSWQDYTAFTPVSPTDTISVNFINDDGPRDVRIDYITVDGTTYQAEDQVVNTGGWNYAASACGAGVQGEWLQCNGWIGFPMTPPATDNFNRLNEDPLSFSGKWQTITGLNKMKLVSNQAVGYNNGTTGHSGAIYTGLTFGSNQYSRATFANVDEQVGLFILTSRTATETGYLSYAHPLNGENYNIIRVDNGSYTYLAEHPSRSAVIGDRVSFEKVGSVLRLIVNGQEILNANDNTYTSGYPGIKVFQSNSSNKAILDDWEGGNL